MLALYSAQFWIYNYLIILVVYFVEFLCLSLQLQNEYNLKIWVIVTFGLYALHILLKGKELTRKVVANNRASFFVTLAIALMSAGIGTYSQMETYNFLQEKESNYVAGLNLIEFPVQIGNKVSLSEENIYLLTPNMDEKEIKRIINHHHNSFWPIESKTPLMVAPNKALTYGKLQEVLNIARKRTLLKIAYIGKSTYKLRHALHDNTADFSIKISPYDTTIYAPIDPKTS